MKNLLKRLERQIAYDRRLGNMYYPHLLSLDELEFLCHAVRMADKFVSKFGTREHPVQVWYEDALIDLELALYDCYDPKRCCDNGFIGKRHKCQKVKG